MKEGWYILRLPNGSPARNRTSLIVETRPIQNRDSAVTWKHFIKSEHPKDHVFMTFIKEEQDDDED